MKKLKRSAVSIFTGARKKEQDIMLSKGPDDSESNEHRSTRRCRLATIQNCVLVWLNDGTDTINDYDCCDVMAEWEQVVNTVCTFTDVDSFVDFITDAKEKDIFLIVSAAFVQTAIPVIHDLIQVRYIYIFCADNAQDERETNQWRKVQGKFTDIKSICEAIKLVSQDRLEHSISISVVSMDDIVPNENLDHLDQSFMYTQILKEILLTIDFDQKHLDEYFTYCKKLFVDNIVTLRTVDEMEREYHHHQSIRWYTGTSFLCSMINRALRVMDTEMIIKMGFLIRDLHQHIAYLHSQQYSDRNRSSPFTVYRGQSLSKKDFKQLMEAKGGLLSFNHFLSTTKKRELALVFAPNDDEKSDSMGILFVMTIDPSISSTPFADISGLSYIQEEEETLFSMHAVFRVSQIKLLDSSRRLYQVDLMLTDDTDLHFHALTKYIRKESFPHKKGWYRLGCLLIKLAEFNQAQKVFQDMLDQTSDHCEKANIYHMMGIIQYEIGNYEEAIKFYQQSIEINQKILPSNHPDLAASYRNIGVVYEKMARHSITYSSDEKAFDIFQTTDSSISDNKIAMNYDGMDDYSQALLSCEKVPEVLQQTFPAGHPCLSTLYDRFGSVYENLNDYEKARSLYKRALQIKQKRLSPNHPSLATSYANPGAIYEKMGESSIARSCYQRALNIGKRSLPANHPDLQVYRQRVGDD